MDAAPDDVFIDEISFPATDGYALTGTLFLPRGIVGLFARRRSGGVPLPAEPSSPAEAASREAAS